MRPGVGRDDLSAAPVGHRAARSRTLEHRPAANRPTGAAAAASGHTDGRLAGYELGWRVTTTPIQISSTMDVDVKTTPLTAFSLEGLTVDVAQIFAGGPKVSLYAGLGQGFLAIRTAGVYTLTLRLERSAGPSADCLTRLGFGPHRIVSTLNIGFGNDVKTFEAPRFDLQPGLYPIGWAFSCWHGHEVVGPGRITLLVGHPGDPTPLPARSADIVRQERIEP